ncbi:MAG: DUF2007 domain-containing protein [Gammaproteobacteria bacterium]|jgi:hypothetical protein|nr:DUF2007 domain-containing protein [Gammaproteobacteria bacterium]
MKAVYDAANAIEAHMIVHLLGQSGIYGRVEGEHLQGAMGELPATGLVRVCVNADAVDAARQVIRDWEATQPPQATPPAAETTAQRLSYFLAGIIVGAVAALLLVR